MNKICTSIEQSKKLMELGINVNTADMYYEEVCNLPKAIVGNYILHNQCMEDKDYKKLSNPVLSPAWSLSALLELMPTDDKKDEYYVDTESHSDYHTVNYRNCWDGYIHSEYSEESLLDAAFEMVVWLLENKKI